MNDPVENAIGKRSVTATELLIPALFLVLRTEDRRFPVVSLAQDLEYVRLLLLRQREKKPV